MRQMFCHFQHAEPVVCVAVHTAGAHQTHQMDGLAGIDGSLHVLNQNRVLEHLAVLDGLGNEGELLVHDAASAHVGVANLRVAHLALGQTDGHAGSVDGGHGIFCHQSIEVGFLCSDHALPKVSSGTQPKPSMMHRRTGFFAIKLNLL